MSTNPRIAIQSVAGDAFVGVGTAIATLFYRVYVIYAGKRLVRSITNLKKADL